MLDRRLLIGVALVIILGIGAFAVLNRPSTPENGEDDIPENVTIRGTVIDEDTGEPLNTVTVSVNGYTTSTDETGEYEIAVKEGTYTVTVEKDDFESESSEVATTEESYTVDFVLAPKEQPTSEEVVLKIITRHGSDITREAELSFLESDYAKENNIVDIRWYPVGSTLWADTIERTGDIDVGWGGGPVLFDVILDEGLLAPLTGDNVTEIMDALPDEISGVPAKRFEDGEVYWVGSAIASFGFTINKNYLESENLPRPSEWNDLANESYAVTLPQACVGTADATKSTSNTRMFEIILQGYDWRKGWELLTRIGANAKIYDQSGLVRDAAIQGQIAVGTTIDFYGYTAQLEAPETCEYILPADGTIVNADPIAMLETSDNPEAAQAFIAWILSADGQKQWLDPKINRLPMNPDVFDTPEGQEREDLEQIYQSTQEALIIEFSDALALSYENSLMWFYHFTIVRPQTFLTDSWMQLTQARFAEEITQQEFIELAQKLGDPYEIEFEDPSTGETHTFTLEYAQSVNEKIGSDSAYRDQLGEAWMEAAEDRYNEVQSELADLTG